MSVPRAAILIHAFVVRKFNKCFIRPVDNYYITRRNPQLVFLNNNQALSTERKRMGCSTIPNKYKYDLQAGR